MLKKLVVGLLYIILCVIACVITGCALNSANETSTLFPTQSLNDETAVLLTPTQSQDDISTASLFPSTEYTSASQTETTCNSTYSPAPTQSESKTNTGDDNMDNNCKLIVRGKDITAGNHVILNYEYRYAELPLTSVMKELGAKVEWQSNATAKIAFGGKEYALNTTACTLVEVESGRGFIYPIGGGYSFREVINNEFVVDGATMTSVVVNMMGAKISIDYDKKIVKID